MGEDLRRLDDAAVVALDILAMLPEHAVFVAIDIWVGPTYVAGVGIFSYELERHFLSRASHPDRDVGLLHTLRFVDSAPHLVIFPLECGVIVFPESMYYLQRLPQHP